MADIPATVDCLVNRASKEIHYRVAARTKEECNAEVTKLTDFFICDVELAETMVRDQGYSRCAHCGPSE